MVRIHPSAKIKTRLAPLSRRHSSFEDADCNGYLLARHGQGFIFRKNKFYFVRRAWLRKRAAGSVVDEKASFLRL
jgi:hypothetical protein